MAVWMSGVSNKEIQGQAFDSNGAKDGAYFRLGNGNLGFDPDVDLNNEGQAIVAWEGLDNSGLGIYAQRMEADGDLVGERITVINSGDSQKEAQVGIAANGNFIVAWLDDEATVRFSLYEQTDTTLNRIRFGRSIGLSDDFHSLPAVSMNNQGEFVIVSRIVGDMTGNIGIRARTYNANGAPNMMGQFLFFNAEDITDFDVALRENGDFLLVWEEFNGTDKDIYLQLFSNFGFPINNAILVNDNTSGNQVNPSIAINSGDDVVVSWTSFGSDDLEQGVYAQRFTITSNQNNVTPTLDESEAAGAGVVQTFAAGAYAPTNATDSVKVAVFDTGIDDDHIELQSALWQNEQTGECLQNDTIGYDFVNADGQPNDIDGHGSSVSGVIVNDFPDEVQLQLISLKFYEGQRGTLFDAVCGIYYAVNAGAKVLNLSWGFEAAQFPEILYDALKYAAERDVLIITSAGNTSKNNDLIQKYPSNFDLDNMIVVTAYQTDPDGSNIRLADYASYGAMTVDLAAAGFVETTNFDGTIVQQTGTSMAAPAVARTAAVLRAQYPCLTAQQIKNCILSNVDTYDSFSGLSVSGGVLNHQTALDCAALVSCLQLEVKVKLQGNFDSNTDLMAQNWATLSLVPTQSPYAASDSTTTSVLQAKTNISENDEIVDWVKVELRDKNDSSIVIAECSALLQRDGDIVDLDGESAVRFYNLASDHYYIAVTHQHHLGVMTAAAIFVN